MRKSLGVACLSAMLFLAVPAVLAVTPTANKGAIVIVFKDGHRQTYNLSEIERIEFAAENQASATGAQSASRKLFLGKWEVGDGAGATFYISLYEDGEAKRTLGNVRGKWEYVDGEARITWDDGAQDAIRHVGNRFQKYAYHAGKSFTDEPDNVTAAKNTMPNPL
ncbi:MAG TPA: hypothetical protein VLZ50_05290 [Terracidiphilus sp.]|nr:hypothetical protein [Terracidiphilus sp.]